MSKLKRKVFTWDYEREAYNSRDPNPSKAALKRWDDTIEEVVNFLQGFGKENVVSIQEEGDKFKRHWIVWYWESEGLEN